MSNKPREMGAVLTALISTVDLKFAGHWQRTYQRIAQEENITALSEMEQCNVLNRWFRRRISIKVTPSVHIVAMIYDNVNAEHWCQNMARWVIPELLKLDPQWFFEE